MRRKADVEGAVKTNQAPHQPLMKFLSILPLMLLSPTASALEARVRQGPAGPQLLVNGQATAPATFFVNMDAGPALLERHLRQIELAGKHGVHIVSVPIDIHPWQNTGPTLASPHEYDDCGRTPDPY